MRLGRVQWIYTRLRKSLVVAGWTWSWSSVKRFRCQVWPMSLWMISAATPASVKQPCMLNGRWKHLYTHRTQLQSTTDEPHVTFTTLLQAQWKTVQIFRKPGAKQSFCLSLKKTKNKKKRIMKKKSPSETDDGLFPLFDDDKNWNVFRYDICHWLFNPSLSHVKCFGFQQRHLWHYADNSGKNTPSLVRAECVWKRKRVKEHHCTSNTHSDTVDPTEPEPKCRTSTQNGIIAASSWHK